MRRNNRQALLVVAVTLEGVRAAYKCAEGPPGSKWNLAGDLPPTTIRRRANAKELRRAYDRAREELRTLEREARPKDIK